MTTRASASRSQPALRRRPRSPLLAIHSDSSVAVTSERVVLCSPLGRHELDDPGIVALAGAIVPLLDGTRTEAQLLASQGGEMAGVVGALLDVLRRWGVLCLIGDQGEGESGLSRFTAIIGGEPYDLAATLRRASVTITGTQPWAPIAARALSAAGVGRVSTPRWVGGSVA